MNRFQTQIRSTLVAQIFAVVFVALMWLIHGLNSSVAAFFGGSAAILSNLFFAWRLFRRMNDRSAHQIVFALYINEILKLMGCALIILILLRIFHLSMIPLLSGLLTAYLVNAPVAIYQQIKMVRR